MLSQIIQNNPNCVQPGFSLTPFINKANGLLPKNELIQISASKVSEYNNGNIISRKDLSQIWTEDKTPLFAKIIITFWWGGISHQFQAPLFYTTENLIRLANINDNFNTDLININNAQKIDIFKSKLKDIYDNLKFGNYHLSGINTAFFTKLLQFGISNTIQPIIVDRWSANAIIAELIDSNQEFSDILKDPKLDKNNIAITQLGGNNMTEFNNYWNLISYFSSVCNKIGIDPLTMECIMFGWGRDNNNPNNPRVIANQIIRNYLENK